MTQQSETLPRNIKKLAILIDWENLRKTLDKAISKFKIKKQTFSYNNSDQLITFIKSFIMPVVILIWLINQ